MLSDQPLAFDSTSGQNPTPAFCVLLAPHPELTSLGFLEDGSKRGRLKHLDDVTNVVRRDVSTAGSSRPLVRADWGEGDRGLGRERGRCSPVLCPLQGRPGVGSHGDCPHNGGDERGIFVAPTLPVPAVLNVAWEGGPKSDSASSVKSVLGRERDGKPPPGASAGGPGPSPEAHTAPRIRIKAHHP